MHGSILVMKIKFDQPSHSPCLMARWCLVHVHVAYVSLLFDPRAANGLARRDRTHTGAQRSAYMRCLHSGCARSHMLTWATYCLDRYMYHETLGRWHTIDLFVGLAYLANRDAAQYPAADIVEKAVPISVNLQTPEERAAIVVRAQGLESCQRPCALAHCKAHTCMHACSPLL